MYLNDYNLPMYTVLRSSLFDAWLSNLRDGRAHARIASRIKTVQRGSLGDYKSLDGGLFELRIDYGPGYRVYFTRKEDLIILLLIGGAKSSQKRDITRARAMMEE